MDLRFLLLALALSCGVCRASPSSGSATEEQNLASCLVAADGDKRLVTDCYFEAQSSADARLNAAYDGLRRVLEPAEFSRLRQAQRKWMAFREASRSAADEMFRDEFGGGAGQLILNLQADYAVVRDRANELETILDHFESQAEP